MSSHDPMQWVNENQRFATGSTATHRKVVEKHTKKGSDVTFLKKMVVPVPMINVS